MLAIMLLLGTMCGNDPQALPVGVIASLFRDVSGPDRFTIGGVWRQTMADELGCTTTSAEYKTADLLAAALQDGRVKLGIFQGYEYAWINQKNPNLKPLVVCVNQKPQMSALLITTGVVGMNRWSEMEGVRLTRDVISPPHCLFFLTRSLSKPPEKFFKSITLNPDAETSLDEVVDNKQDVALVNGIAWERYRQRKPIRSSNMHIVVESPWFPAPAIVYKDGAIKPELLMKVKDLFMNMHRSANGRQFLMLWMLTSFEQVPDNYPKQLDEIRTKYPKE